MQTQSAIQNAAGNANGLATHEVTYGAAQRLRSAQYGWFWPSIGNRRLLGAKVQPWKSDNTDVSRERCGFDGWGCAALYQACVAQHGIILALLRKQCAGSLAGMAAELRSFCSYW